MIIIKVFICIITLILIYHIINYILSLNYTNIIKIFKYFVKKNNYIKNISKSLDYIKKVYPINISIINTFNLFVFSVIFAIIVFILVFYNLKLILSSFIISIIFFILPMLFLEIIKIQLKNKIKKSFSLYIIGFESFSKNSNDIIMALKQIQATKPLNIFINEFNNLLNSGFEIVKALNFLADEINIKEINIFIHLLKLCYINGGCISKVINQFNKYYVQISSLRKKQKEKMNYYLFILGIIILVNIFLVFYVILKNTIYKEIIFNSILGRVLIDFNVFLYLIIILTIMKIIKREE